MANNVSDQIRKLTNNVHFAGALAELDSIHEGTTQDGTPYIQFKGVVQCGPTAVYCRPFRCFVKAKNSKGEDSKQFANAKKWYDNAVPMTKDAEHPTMVDMTGSINTNDWVGVDGKLYEGQQFSVQFFNEFKEYLCNIDIEGYIASVTDEERGQEDDRHPTGRKIINLYSMDFYHNVINLKRVIIPKENVPYLDDCEWEKGRTAMFYLTYQPNSTEDAKPTKRGFGQQRTTSGTKSYLELVCTGGDASIPEDSNLSIAPATGKLMMSQRAQALQELESKGYQGKGGAGAQAVNRNSFGSAKAQTGKFTPVMDIDDDDIPF